MRRLIIPIIITALIFTASPAWSSNLGGSIIVTIGRSAQDGNNLINFTISGLEANKGIVQAAENDHFFIEAGIVVLNLQSQDPINVVTNPAPTDSGMEAEEDDEIRKGNNVKLRSQTRAIPFDSASIIKDLLDQCIPLGYEVSISLVLVDSAGGRHYLDTTTINGPINYIAAQDDTTCDNVDDDCDGTIDEDYITEIITCGIGACTNTVASSCVDGNVVSNCIPGIPSDEACDGIDNDCDGATDEELTRITNCGVGVCSENTGIETCINGSWENDSCDPLAGAAPNDTSCDDVDDDCDGIVDEDYVTVATNCGTGACESAGELQCVDGEVVDSCTPGSPGLDDAICNSIDDDCDGTVDEDYVSVATTCGVGICDGNTGSTSCVDGQIVDSCDPLAGSSRDRNCDGLDDDCDGTVDEHFPSVATTCGVGICDGNTGSTSCVDGQVVDSCDPLAGALAELCDDLDNDCDGAVDEDFSAGSPCGTGQCTGDLICTADKFGTVCSSSDSPCPDGEYCNGDEMCDSSGTCQPGTLVVCNDGISCTDDICDEVTDECSHTPNDENCGDDGFFCTGYEYCDPIDDCVSSGNPCQFDEECNENSDICVAVGDSCVACHASPQPTGSGEYRRQVTGTGGDFERAIHHVSSGTPTDHVTDNDCLVCHDQNNHQSIIDPNVDLNDPDGSSSFTYNGTGASIELFCINCHDLDGSTAYDSDAATTGSQPFSTGTTPTVIPSSWSISAHGSPVAGILSDGKCLTCHGGSDSTQPPGSDDKNTHGSSSRSLLSSRIASKVATNDEEGVCFTCHDGSSATDIESVFSGKVYKHPVGDQTSQGRHTYSEGQSYGWNPTASRHVECEDCHNPHTATVANPIEGVWGVSVDFTGKTSGQAPTYTRVSSVTSETELCLKCHSEYGWGVGSTPPLVPSGPPDSGTVGYPPDGTYPDTSWPYFPEATDVGADFNPNNMGYHPIFAEGKNQPPIDANPAWKTSRALACDPSLPGWWPCKVKGNKSSTWTRGPNPDQGLDNTFVDGWGSRSLVTCSDCHASDLSTDPGGAHGSANPWLLKGLDRSVTVTLTDGTVVDINAGLPSEFDRYFCFNCHRYDVYQMEFPVENPFDVASWQDNDDYYPELSRIPHADMFPVYSTFVNSTTAWGIKCMHCHGGNNHGGIHGSNMDNRAHQGADPQGERLLNGASLIGVSRGTTSFHYQIWSKPSSDSVSDLAHSYIGVDSKTPATYDYP